MRKFLITAALLMAATLCWGQQMPENLPIDPTIRTGKLDNGLTYFIRHNEKPSNRAEFYLATNVGALQETPDQDGLAHFLEHMCFNGTKNFPEKGILNWLESIGASFGGNVNASTGVERTIYLLNNIPLVRPTVVDSCLLIMHDYSHFVTCDPVEIDKERGVILEEKRSRNNAGWRTFERSQPYLYGDSKYNGCTIIGSEENLKTFRPESLTNFYHTWYRPDMQALIVVGDINVDEVEAKIKSTFADIEAPVNPKQKERIVIPDNETPIVGIITDPETSNSSIEVIWKTERNPEELNNTIIGFLSDNIEFLVRAVMVERLDEIKSKADAPFVAANFGMGKLCEASDMISINAEFENGKAESSLEAMLLACKKLRVYGITDEEFERAKSMLLSRYESAAKSADTRSNGQFIRPVINHFFDNETLLDPDTEYQLAQQLMTVLNADAINQSLKQLFGEKNMIVLYSGPESGNTPAEKDLLDIIAKVEDTIIEAPVREALPERLLDESKLKGCKIRKSKDYIYGSEILTLANGMDVILYKTDKIKDKISIDVFKRGGRTLIEQDDLYSFDDNLWQLYLNNSGVSDFSLKTLKKMLASKVVSAAPYINETSHGVEASSSVKDFETALQLVYLLFTDPRFDEEEYALGIKQIQAILPNLESNPQFVLQKERCSTIYNNDRRFVISSDVLAKSDLKTMERVYRSLFNGAKGSVAIICGDIDLDQTRSLVCKYLGSLPKGKETKSVERNDWIIDGAVKNDFTTAMTTPKVTCFDILKVNTEYSTEMDINSEALAYILEMIYTETLREDEGGTYGAIVNAQTARKPFNASLLQIAFETNEESADKLRALVYEGIQGIATDGPRPEMFDKTVKNLEKKLPERMEGLEFWEMCLRDYKLFGTDYINEYEAAVKALTPEKIKATAAEFLSSSNRIELIMRPE